MPIKDLLLPEFDMEMDNTRRMLERVPDAKFGWKPHEKSGTLGWMASHVATLPLLCYIVVRLLTTYRRHSLCTIVRMTSALML